MSGLEKILEHIETSAKETAEKRLKDAKAEAARIIADSKEESVAKEAAIFKQSEIDVVAASKRIESAANMQEKRMILQAKQEAIVDVLDSAAEQLKNLGDAEYFEIILKMIPKYAQLKSGKLCFSAKDLARLPEGFEAKANCTLPDLASLVISDEAADIDGGFILDYGEIAENCSFDSLIEDLKGNLNEKIGQILFS